MTPDEQLQELIASNSIGYTGTSPDPYTEAPGESAPSRMFTNIPEVRSSSPVPVSWVGQEQVQPPTQPIAKINPFDSAFQGIRDFTTQVEAAKTYGDKNRLMLDLRQNAMTYVEKAQAEAKADIEKKIGLDQFRQVYTNAQQIAAQNPKYAKELFAMEQQMAVMEGRAQSLTAAALKENVQLQTYIKTVDKELQIQDQMARKFEADQQKKLDKLDSQKEAAFDILAGVKPEVVDTIAELFTDPNTKQSNFKDANGKLDSVAMAKFITSHKGKEWEPLLSGTIPEDKYLAYGLMGNKAAKVMAITQQSKLTGQSLPSVKQDVDYAESLLMNPNLLAQEMKTYNIPSGLTKAEEDKAKAKNIMGGGTPSKKEQEDTLLKNIGNVEKVLAARTDRKLSDISTWNPEHTPLSDPTAQNIYESTKLKLGRKPDIVEFAKAYVNEPGLEPEIKAAREKAILTGYEANAEKSMKGIFSVPLTKGDIADRLRKIRVGTTLDTVNKPGVSASARGIGASLSSIMSTGAQMYAGSGVGSFISASAINNPSSTVDVPGTIDEFLTGLLRGK